jgi:hypothetical protein
MTPARVNPMSRDVFRRIGLTNVPVDRKPARLAWLSGGGNCAEAG